MLSIIARWKYATWKLFQQDERYRLFLGKDFKIIAGKFL